MKPIATTSRCCLQTIGFHMKSRFPEFWKLLCAEINEYSQNGQSMPRLVTNELLRVMKYVTVPLAVGLGCIALGIIPLGPIWVTVLIMVHYMTSQLHDVENHEPVVSPKFWIRFMADMLVGFLGHYFHVEPIYPIPQLELKNYIAAWIICFMSCLTMSCLDFAVYRMYLSLLRGGAVTYRILHPEVSTELNREHSSLQSCEKAEECYSKKD